MPEIARFNGVVIQMFWRDHEPPHFHVRFGGARARVDIGTGRTTGDAIPRHIARMLREWELARRDELIDNWRRARRGEEPHTIDPLN